MDIEQQLMHELNLLSEQVTYIKILHVKGHQDNDKQQIITTEAALNVEADELTHIARKLQCVTNYAPFPTNNVNFVLNNHYIIHRWSTSLSTAWHPENNTRTNTDGHPKSSIRYGGLYTSNHYPNYPIRISYISRNLSTIDYQRYTESRSTTRKKQHQAIASNANYIQKQKII